MIYIPYNVSIQTGQIRLLCDEFHINWILGGLTVAE